MSTSSSDKKDALKYGVQTVGDAANNVL